MICTAAICDIYDLSQPVHFPNTYQDLDFTEQMHTKSEGYGEYANLTEYEQLFLDSLNEAIAEMPEDDNQETTEDQVYIEPEITPVIPEHTLEPDLVTAQSTAPKPTQAITAPVTPITKQTQQTSRTINTTSVSSGGYCAIRQPYIPDNQKLPIGSPVLREDYVYCCHYGIVDRQQGPRSHTGMDIGCLPKMFNKPVFVPADGTVTSITHNGLGSVSGNMITIKHENGFTTRYHHLNRMFVKKGQKVSAGCSIGTIGNTGASKETKDPKNPSPHFAKKMSHLHYEIHYTGKLKSVKSATGGTVKIERKFSEKDRHKIDPAPFLCEYAKFRYGCPKK